MATHTALLEHRADGWEFVDGYGLPVSPDLWAASKIDRQHRPTSGEIAARIAGLDDSGSCRFHYAGAWIASSRTPIRANPCRRRIPCTIRLQLQIRTDPYPRATAADHDRNAAYIAFLVVSGGPMHRA